MDEYTQRDNHKHVYSTPRKNRPYLFTGSNTINDVIQQCDAGLAVKMSVGYHQSLLESGTKRQFVTYVNASISIHRNFS